MQPCHKAGLVGFLEIIFGEILFSRTLSSTLVFGADFREAQHSSAFCLRFQCVGELSTKTKNQNEVGEKKSRKISVLFVWVILGLSTGIVGSDEGRIGHNGGVPSDCVLLKVVEICSCGSDILSSPAQW